MKLIVSPTPTNNTSPLLYGIFVENLNYAGDGGLYAELINNRAFQGSPEHPPTTKHWSPIGNVSLNLNHNNPISFSLQSSLQVSNIPNSSLQQTVGICNTGFWGIEVVNGREYTGSFHVRLEKGPFCGFFEVALMTTQGMVYVSKKIQVGISSIWTEVPFTLKVPEYGVYCQKAASNVFALTWTSTPDTVLNFNLISLFPPTSFKNGFRPDLVKVLKNLKPAFFRFPGGTDLQGDTIKDRFQWEHTIGPVINRTGRWGSWGYYQTNGLGLLEYMLLAEELNAEPVLGVFTGYSIRWNGAGIPWEEVVPENKLSPFVKSVMNEIEYCVGKQDTNYGRLRASHGRLEPFSLKFIELGNEDWGGPVGRETYGYRFRAFYAAIKAKYPEITIICTADDGITIPPDVLLDKHFYRRPNNWSAMFNTFDNWSGPKLCIGEFASIQPDEYNNPTNDPNLSIDWESPVRLEFPTMKGTVGEAIFAFGMERNQNHVLLSSYAPLLQNANDKAWTPNLIQFNADESETVLSTSYYLQKMLAENLGTVSLPVISETLCGPVYWVASFDSKAKEVILKLCNFGEMEQFVEIVFPFRLGRGRLTTLTGPANASNMPKKKDILPVVEDVVANDKGEVNIRTPKWSVQVVRFATLGGW